MVVTGIPPICNEQMTTHVHGRDETQTGAPGMSHTMRTSLLLSVATILCRPLAAEETAPRDMHLSLSECIEIALGNNSAIT